MKKLLAIIFFPLTLVCFVSCSSNAEKQEEVPASDVQTLEDLGQSRINAQNVFNSLPDRGMVVKLLQENKLEYNPDLLNNPNSVNKYSTEFYKAANLGIYGSDLCVASSFEQTQESMIFLKCVNILSNYMGVNSAFDQKMFERIEASNNNKDSVMKIVINAFRRVDEILKSNNRSGISAVILSGCWIEGLYISCRMAETVNHESIIKAILSQHESLKNLIVMMENEKREQNAAFILNELRNLKSIFDQVQIDKNLDKESISSITKKITEIRTRIVTVPA